MLYVVYVYSDFKLFVEWKDGEQQAVITKNKVTAVKFKQNRDFKFTVPVIVMYRVCHAYLSPTCGLFLPLNSFIPSWVPSRSSGYSPVSVSFFGASVRSSASEKLVSPTWSFDESLSQSSTLSWTLNVLSYRRTFSQPRAAYSQTFKHRSDLRP